MPSFDIFQPRIQGQDWPFAITKIVCVGRNYAEHAAELNNPVPSEPLLFIKPSTAAVDMQQPLRLPSGQGEVHYETEIALLIGQPLCNAEVGDCMAAVAGVGLALDLTLRDLQSALKQKGHPWEKAKAWDASCPLTAFVPASQVSDWEALQLSLTLNGALKQQGRASQMITPIPQLLSSISQHFTLLPGDVVLTGTPAGVGALHSGDQLELALEGLLEISTRVN